MPWANRQLFLVLQAMATQRPEYCAALRQELLIEVHTIARSTTPSGTVPVTGGGKRYRPSVVTALPFAACFWVAGVSCHGCHTQHGVSGIVWFIALMVAIYVLHVARYVYMVARYVYAAEGVAPAPFDDKSNDHGVEV